MGKNNNIYPNAILGGDPQDLSFDKKLKTYFEIGDGNVFREGTLIHRATKEGKATIVGNENYIMGGVHMAHDGIMGNNNIVVQNSIIAGHCRIADKVFISGLVAIHQFAKIGSYAMLGGCSKIVKDVPPYTTIDGHPAYVIGLNVVGLKRAGFTPDIRTQIKRAYKLIYHSGKNFKDAIAELKTWENLSKEVQGIIKFFEESDRGVSDHRPIGSGDSED